jgi:hypothetical protein
MAVWLDGPCVKSTHTLHCTGSWHWQGILAIFICRILVCKDKGEAQHSQEIKMRYRGHVLDHDSAQVQHGMQCNNPSDEWRLTWSRNHWCPLVNLTISLLSCSCWAAASSLQGNCEWRWLCLCVLVHNSCRTTGRWALIYQSADLMVELVDYYKMIIPSSSLFLSFPIQYTSSSSHGCLFSFWHDLFGDFQLSWLGPSNRLLYLVG